jgi:uncharacterized surface protein with fasciclin (FAS1) repeats
MTSRVHRPPSASELPASANSWLGQVAIDRRTADAEGITVSAPTNDAFGALPKPTLDKVVGDPRAC